MGNLIRITEKEKRQESRPEQETRSEKSDISGKKGRAHILMFTGVRYERGDKSETDKATLPSSPKPKHKSG